MQQLRLEDTADDSSDLYVPNTQIIAQMNSTVLCLNCNVENVFIDSLILAHQPICSGCEEDRSLKLASLSGALEEVSIPSIDEEYECITHDKEFHAMEFDSAEERDAHFEILNEEYMRFLNNNYCKFVEFHVKDVSIVIVIMMIQILLTTLFY